MSQAKLFESCGKTKEEEEEIEEKESRKISFEKIKGQFQLIENVEVKGETKWRRTKKSVEFSSCCKRQYGIFYHYK